MRAIVLCLVLLAPAAVAGEIAKPGHTSASVLSRVRDGLRQLATTLAPYVFTTSRGEAGKAWPSNDAADVQPVWDEPSGRIPTREERGTTCGDGNVSFMMPTPWMDWLHSWGVLK